MKTPPMFPVFQVFTVQPNGRAELRGKNTGLLSVHDGSAESGVMVFREGASDSPRRHARFRVVKAVAVETNEDGSYLLTATPLTDFPIKAA